MSIQRDKRKRKCALQLIDPLATEGLGWALSYGEQKYSADGWDTADMSWRDVIGAIKRHLSAVERGEDIDQESGLPHVDCVGAEWMILSAMMKAGQGVDDRRTTVRADGRTPEDIRYPDLTEHDIVTRIAPPLVSYASIRYPCDADGVPIIPEMTRNERISSDD